MPKANKKKAKNGKIYVGWRVRRKSRQILQDGFRIKAIYGVVLDYDEKTGRYSPDESPNKICILVHPKKDGILDPIYHDVDLSNYPEFAEYGITTASPAKLAHIAVKGWVYPELDLEHLDHHHGCINPHHHHPVPRKLNQYRKIHKKPAHKLCLRDEETGRFIKRMKLRTYIPAECDHDPEPNCTFNLVNSTPKHWETGAQRRIYQSLVQKSLPKFKLSPLWK